MSIKLNKSKIKTYFIFPCVLMMLYFVLYSLGLLKKSLTISGCFRLWYLYAIFVNTTSKPKDKLVDFPFGKYCSLSLLYL
jgi:hypothetical protein